MSKQGTAGGIITSAVVGGIVGAAAALLLAPKSGERLRSDLVSSLQAIGQRTKEVAASVCENTREAAQGAVEGVKGAVDGVKSDVNSMAPLQDDIHRLGKEMDAMPTNTEVKNKGLQPDPTQ
ncbi:YtxH domain-containing protein [Paenibacillus sp. strain BS8-2]